MKWSELEKMGVKRCCAMFSRRMPGGKRRSRQCRRRAVEGTSWCEKHSWIEGYTNRLNEAALEAERRSQEKDPNDDEKNGGDAE